MSVPPDTGDSIWLVIGRHIDTTEDCDEKWICSTWRTEAEARTERDRIEGEAGRIGSDVIAGRMAMAPYPIGDAYDVLRVPVGVPAGMIEGWYWCGSRVPFSHREPG